MNKDNTPHTDDILVSSHDPGEDILRLKAQADIDLSMKTDVVNGEINIGAKILLPITLLLHLISKFAQKRNKDPR